MYLFLEILTSAIRSGEVILVEPIDMVNSVIIFPSQMNLPRCLTFLLVSLTVIHTVLLFWIYLFLLTLVFALIWLSLHLRNSDHVVASVSIGFPANTKQGVPFLRIAYDYYRAYWDGLRDHSRDIQCEDIFKLSASAAASEFCDWVQVGTDVYISNRKYQDMSIVFSWLCCCYSS